MTGGGPQPWPVTFGATALALILISCGGAGAGAPDDGLTIRNPYHGRWQGRSEAPIHFHLEQTFGADDKGPDGALLSRIAHPFADDDGNVYLFDGKEHRLVSFSPDGNFRWSAGRQGQGPDEFQEVGGMVWDGMDRLLVLNSRGSRIEEYALDGRHLRHVPVGLDSLGYVSLQGRLDSDHLVFARSGMGRIGVSVHVASYGDELNLLARIDEDQTGGQRIGDFMSYAPPVMIVGDRIAISDVHGYRLSLYDTAGTLVRIVHRDMHDLVRPGFFDGEHRRAVASMGGLTGAVRLRSGHLLTYAYWPTNVDDPDDFIRRVVEGNAPDVSYAHTIDIFDRDDRLLYSMGGDGVLPEIGQPEFVDRAGRLYTSMIEPYPHVRRYRVEIDE